MNNETEVNAVIKRLIECDGTENVTDKYLFLIALIGVNMKTLSLANALLRSALDLEDAMKKFERDRWDAENPGVLRYSFEGWLETIYAAEWYSPK